MKEKWEKKKTGKHLKWSLNGSEGEKILSVTEWHHFCSHCHVWLFGTPWDCSTSGFPSLHYLPEFVKIHIHWVSDAIQPSHPLSSPSPPAFNLSQHQGLLQWVSSLHQVAKVLELQLQHHSFQWIFKGWFALRWTGLISLHSKRLSRVFSSTIWIHQFFGTQPSLWSNSHICTWLLEKP